MAGLLEQLLGTGAWMPPAVARNPFDAEPTEEQFAKASQAATALSPARWGRRAPSGPFDVGTPGIAGIGLLGGGPLGGGAIPSMADIALSVGGKVQGRPDPTPTPLNDPFAGAPENGAPTTEGATGDVPLPRPRPAMADEATSIPPAATSTVGAVPQLPGPADQGETASPFTGMLSRLFNPDNAPALLALASGFAGAPDIGTGMRRAFGAAAPHAAVMNAGRSKKENITTTVRALMERGVPQREAFAAARNPEMMKSVVAKYFESRPGIVAGNKLIDPVTGREIATVPEKVDLPAGFRRSADGVGLEYIPGGPADPKYKRASGDRQNAPPGYRWADPNNPERKLVAIPGGPAEKVDANVAARLGLAKSFLAQLPSIRERVNRGLATGPVDAVLGATGYGDAGELRRQIASGSEALLRQLTGAGMNLVEAQKYVARYELQPHDTIERVNSKLNQLERELRATVDEVSLGRGGDERGSATQGGLRPGQSVTINGVKIERID